MPRFDLTRGPRPPESLHACYIHALLTYIHDADHRRARAAYKRNRAYTDGPTFTFVRELLLSNLIPCAMPIPATRSLSVVREIPCTTQPSSGPGYVQYRALDYKCLVCLRPLCCEPVVLRDIADPDSVDCQALQQQLSAVPTVFRQTVVVSSVYGDSIGIFAVGDARMCGAQASVGPWLCHPAAR